MSLFCYGIYFGGYIFFLLLFDCVGVCEMGVCVCEKVYVRKVCVFLPGVCECENINQCLHSIVPCKQNTFGVQ